jgi:coenzyme F420 biosynthesis associated uncharacterized protein
VTVLGRRAERSARKGLIDWKAVERLAADRVRNAAGTLASFELQQAAPIYASAMDEIVPALSRALDTELPGIVDRSGIVSREEWVHANVATFEALMSKVEGELLGQVLPPGAGLVKAAMAIANRMVTTRQFGYLLGFMGQRVLGQYDFALISAESTPGRLLFVDENIRRTAAILDVPLNPFRVWIALHETTHAFEFEAHPWLRPYLSARLERQLGSLSSGVSAMNGRAVGRVGRALRGAASGESWMEGLMTADQRREFREIQAVMSLLEGFGDYMMDEVGRDLVPDVEHISSLPCAATAAQRLREGDDATDRNGPQNGAVPQRGGVRCRNRAGPRRRGVARAVAWSGESALTGGDRSTVALDRKGLAGALNRAV